MTKLTIAGPKKLTPKLRPLVKQMILAKAFAKAERERVDAYILPLFQTFTFVDADGERITDPELLYQCEDDALCTAYYAACDKTHREHGFTGSEGACPALVAKHELLKAEWAVLEVIEKFAGVDFSIDLDIRAKALDLCVDLAGA